MIKVLAIGLSLALGSGVAFAQSKKAPPRKRPPAADKKSDPKPDKQPAPTPDPAPAATPSPAPATPAAPSPAAPAGKPAPGAKPVPMKTDEKAGTKLEKGHLGERIVSPDDEKQAAASFRIGNEHLNNGLFPQAVQKYREALSHWDHPAIHYNLALALINLDQPIEVFDELNKAIAYGEEPLEKDKYDHAKDYLKLVEGQLADIEVSCDKPGAKVSVDGKEVFTAPGTYAAKVRVGKHTFYADKQGYNARITAPFVGPGEKFRIELKLYTAEELTRYRRKWNSTWVPYTVMGAGAVVGILGGILEISAQSSYDAYNTKVAACRTDTAGCPTNTPGINSDRDSGDTKRVLGYVGYGVAGAAIATGVVLAYLNRRQSYQISAEDLSQEHGPISVAPIVSPEVVGAMVQGHF